MLWIEESKGLGAVLAVFVLWYLSVKSLEMLFQCEIQLERCWNKVVLWWDADIKTLFWTQRELQVRHSGSLRQGHKVKGGFRAILPLGRVIGVESRNRLFTLHHFNSQQMCRLWCSEECRKNNYIDLIFSITLFVATWWLIKTLVWDLEEDPQRTSKCGWSADSFTSFIFGIFY